MNGLMMTVIAPGAPDFQLHTLGWNAFQDLAGVILREVLGQSFQTFADTNDQGRDGAFYGSWRDIDGRHGISDGPFVLQCKHISRADVNLTPSMLNEDFKKIPDLVQRGLCETYIVLTNARVTGASEALIREKISDLGVNSVHVLGGGWVNQTIAAHKTLRLFVPRVYGLGDLSQILDERALLHAKALLSYLENDLASFVITDAYQQAAEAIRSHGFVLLLGEPAAGKSLIAATLAMTALDNWDCFTLKVDNPTELVKHWNPNEPNQFFWVDDAFGVLRHDRSLTDDWVRRLPKIMAAISNGARIVLTSRDYIYREARGLLKEYAYPLLREQQVIVNVDSLTREERQQILYNHIRLGNQPRGVRSALKPHLDDVADVVPFRPEVARRLGNSSFTSNISYTLPELVSFMKRPMQFLRDIYNELGPEHQAALTIVQSEGALSIPLQLSDTQRHIISRFGVAEQTLLNALRSLEGTFLRSSTLPGHPDKNAWTFRHPTLREGFAAYIDEDINRIAEFVNGLSDQEILKQIDCGSAKQPGTLVHIPPVLYHQVAERVLAIRTDRYGPYSLRYMWHQFFTSRTSKQFLTVCLEIDPNFSARLTKFISYLDSAEEPAVLARLHQEGLLSEKDRSAAVRNLRELAIETPEGVWLEQQEWAVILTPEERSSILKEVEQKVLPNLDDFIFNHGSNRPSEEDPSEWYEPLEEALLCYSRTFANTDSMRFIAAALDRLDQSRSSDYSDWESPQYSDRPTLKSNYDPISGRSTSSINADIGESRSIFDDIDSYD